MRSGQLFLPALLWVAVLFIPSVLAQANGSIGVGVGLGEIRVTEVLTPGGVYKLPEIPLINTGSISSQYELVAVNGRPGLFSFRPARFSLEPNQSRNVTVQLNLPFDFPQGNYLTFVEAHPVSFGGAGEGQVQIGVAAATKIYYSVGTSPTVLGAVRQRVLSLWQLYLPWSLILVLSLDFLAILLLLRSMLALSISLHPRRVAGQPPKEPEGKESGANSSGS